MGELVDEMVEGRSCSWCGIYFIKKHGYPVACKSCWKDATPGEEGIPQAIHAERSGGRTMFSVRQKQEIAEKVQQILRETNHPELPKGEIQFLLHVDGAALYSWADIRNSGAGGVSKVNPWNEDQDPRKEPVT